MTAFSSRFLAFTVLALSASSALAGPAPPVPTGSFSKRTIPIIGGLIKNLPILGGNGTNSTNSTGSSNGTHIIGFYNGTESNSTFPVRLGSRQDNGDGIVNVDQDAISNLLPDHAAGDNNDDEMDASVGVSKRYVPRATGVPVRPRQAGPSVLPQAPSMMMPRPSMVPRQVSARPVPSMAAPRPSMVPRQVSARPVPSARPSARPSMGPRQVSMRPAQPSARPSMVPSMQAPRPSMRPSMQPPTPSMRPSMQPARPSMQPAVPSMRPSMQPASPSMRPSMPAPRPSAQPSARPSMRPSMPSARPSMVPNMRVAVRA